MPPPPSLRLYMKQVRHYVALENLPISIHASADKHRNAAKDGGIEVTFFDGKAFWAFP